MAWSSQVKVKCKLKCSEKINGTKTGSSVESGQWVRILCAACRLQKPFYTYQCAERVNGMGWDGMAGMQRGSVALNGGKR